MNLGFSVFPSLLLEHIRPSAGAGAGAGCRAGKDQCSWSQCPLPFQVCSSALNVPGLSLASIWASGCLPLNSQGLLSLAVLACVLTGGGVGCACGWGLCTVTCLSSEWSWESHFPGRVRSLRFQLVFMVILLCSFEHELTHSVPPLPI